LPQYAVHDDTSLILDGSPAFIVYSISLSLGL
jgi:hypothetical protein